MPNKSLLPAPFAKRFFPWRTGEEHFPLRGFRKEMNRLFDDYFRGLDSPWPETWEGEEGGYMPRIDVSETDKELIVTAELPGLTEKEVEVSIADDVLTISGEKKEEKEEKVKGHHRMERTYGSFYRTIPIPYEVIQDKIDASVKSGVLKVVLPKMEPTKKNGKKITVKSA